MESNENESPSLIVLDIPRAVLEKDWLNYGMIEQIKNGMVYSGKYEGGTCIFRSPHIIIFANDLPNGTAWSKDRYRLKQIKE